jgi:hypothetical protein
MSAQDAVLDCLTVCSTALRQLQKLLAERQGLSPTLHEVIIQLKYVASSLSALNSVFYDPEKDFSFQIETNADLERLFQLTMRPCSMIFTGLLSQISAVNTRAIPSIHDNNVWKSYLSLIRSLRSGISILVSTLQRYQ